jgi:hypothetical protein
MIEAELMDAIFAYFYFDLGINQHAFIQTVIFLGIYIRCQVPERKKWKVSSLQCAFLGS